MSILLSDLRLYGLGEYAGSRWVDYRRCHRFRQADRIRHGHDTDLYDSRLSSVSDTLSKVIYSGRDSSGVVQSETLTATGTTKVNGTKTLERLLSALASGAASAFGLVTPGGTQAVGDLALMAHTLTIAAHTMQAGSANATAVNPPVAKLQAGDGASVAVGMILRTTGGTGPNQIRRILAINPNSLGADFVALDRNWTTLPDATTTYEVAPGFHFELTGSNGGVAIAGTTTQCLAITRLFVGSSADVAGGSARTYYEKGFLNNNNQAVALTTAQVEIASDSPALPGTALDLALCTALNDTNTSTNRQTAPAAALEHSLFNRA